MSVLVSLLQECPNIQDGLNQTFQTCGSGSQESMPFYEWVSNQMNNANLQQKMVQGNKLRTVELVYDQRILESQAKLGYVDCVATTQRGNKKSTYELDTNDTVTMEEIISVSNLASICENNGSRLFGILNRLVDAVDRKMATKITTQLVGVSGKWASDVDGVNGSDQLVVKTKKDSSIDPYPTTMEDIDLALKLTGYCGEQFIFAEQNLYKYYRNMLSGCCASNGINLAEQLSLYGKAVMYDRRVASALPGNASIATQAGSLALVTWNENTWFNDVDQRFQSFGNENIGVIVSPRTGNKMDLMIKYECKNIHIIVTQTSKLFAAPEDMFAAGDVYAGVNFVNEILVTNV